MERPPYFNVPSGDTDQSHNLRHEPSALTVASNDATIKGRESLVSLQTQYNGTTSHHHDQPQQPEENDAGHSYAQSASPWANLTTSYGGAGAGAYAPVQDDGPTDIAQPRALSYSHSKRSFSSRLRLSMAPRSGNTKDGYDLALLPHSAPMGTDTIAEEGPYAPILDITTTMGPLSYHDQAFVSTLQEQESKGEPTGGIGQGFRPDATVNETELLTSPTTLGFRLSRSFTRRSTAAAGLDRAATIRHKGQDEANRRGEVIQVVLEDVADTDLSTVEGITGISNPSTKDTNRSKQSQIFYPQPNWKPFSMRWPYLIAIIILSLVLALVQETLFHRFADRPIVKFKAAKDVDPALYFVIKFMPTICAVVYGVLWQFVDFEVRRLEAFHQLSRKDGALAAESLNVDYVTSFNFLRPFRALRLGHWAVALSSCASLLAISLVPTFAAATVIITPGRAVRQDDPDIEKALRFASTWSRLLTGTLAVCSILGIGLFTVLQMRRSGLHADVRGIAGLASMAVVSHILMDFKDMDTVKHEVIHKKLKHRRYVLRNASLAPDAENPISQQHKDKFLSDHLPQNPHPLMLRPAGALPFICGLVLFAVFIPIFLFSPANVITEHAPWVVTALAVCLKLSWNSMETAVKLLEPYKMLAKRHAPASTLFLDYTAIPFGYLPIRAFIDGHMLIFFVGFGSIMTEFLTILVSSLATVEGAQFLVSTSSALNGKDSGAETYVSFYVSLILALFILMYMTGVAIVVFLRRRHPFLPRQPNTIASVLAYIHQSKMLYDFVGTEKLSVEQTTKKLGSAKTYGLGWFMGRDGQAHCGVDEEELKGDYKHGVEFLEENQPWNTRWDTYN